MGAIIGFRVWGLGAFGFWGLGFLSFRVQGLGEFGMAAFKV